MGWDFCFHVEPKTLKESSAIQDNLRKGKNLLLASRKKSPNHNFPSLNSSHNLFSSSTFFKYTLQPFPNILNLAHPAPANLQPPSQDPQQRQALPIDFRTYRTVPIPSRILQICNHLFRLHACQKPDSDSADVVLS